MSSVSISRNINCICFHETLWYSSQNVNVVHAVALLLKCTIIFILNNNLCIQSKGIFHKPQNCADHNDNIWVALLNCADKTIFTFTKSIVSKQ